MKHPTIRPLESRDVAPISAVFSGLGWNKPPRHMSATFRSSKVEFVPSSSPFLKETAPGTKQLYRPLPTYPFGLQASRRSGLQRAAALQAARDRDPPDGRGGEEGLGTFWRRRNRGRTALRGYVPDGKGLTSNVIPLRPGDEITVSDGLALYLTKTPAEEPSPKLPSQGAW